MQRIIFLGSNGKLSRSIIKYFINNNIKNIFGISRKKNNLNNKNDILLEYDESTNWSKILQKGDIIIHTAFPKDKATHSILLSEKNLFESCIKTKISKLIYFSTIKVFGETYNKGSLNESSNCKPQTNYGKTKFQIENCLKEVFEDQNKSHYIILRLPIVYGEKISNNLGLLLTFIKIFRLNPFKKINNYRSFLSIKKLNEKLLKIILNKNLSNLTLCIADKKPYSTFDFIEKINKENSTKVLSLNLNFIIIFVLKKFFKKQYMSLYGNLWMDTSKLDKYLS